MWQLKKTKCGYENDRRDVMICLVNTLNVFGPDSAIGRAFLGGCDFFLSTVISASTLYTFAMFFECY